MDDDAPASVDSFLRDVARAPDVHPDAGASSHPRASAAAALKAGALVAGRFRLERRLGEGGMGVVWQAVHAVTRKPVALKFLKRGGDDDSRAVRRFLREARAACAVRHPCVVEVHDVLELEDGSPVMVMELLAGETLADRLTRERVVPLPELSRIMVHVCSAVGCAHALGIVHRDLKPENIFLAQAHGGTDVKVLDFGIAKLTASDGDAAHTGATTGTGAILGTPFYMAPEQLFGEKDIDHRADIWALGIILYEALCGERPTNAANMGQIYKLVMTDTIVPLRERAPQLPAAIHDLVARMMSRDRAARPTDLREVLAVLSEYTSESFVPVEAPAPPSVTVPDTGDRPSVAAYSDTVRASQVVNEGPLHRSGVVITPPERVLPRKGRRLWPVMAVAGFAALGITAVEVWPRQAAPPSPSAAASIAPVPTTTPSASITEPVASEPSAAPAVVAPSTPPAAPARASASPPVVAPIPHGRSHAVPSSAASVKAPSTKPPAASASSPAPAPAPRPPQQPAMQDPASYQ